MEELQKAGKIVRDKFTTLESKVKWVVCPECNDEVMRLDGDRCFECQEKIKEEIEIQKRLVKLLGQSYYDKYKLELFSEYNDSVRKAKERSLLFAPYLDNFYFQGACGVGKTHLAVGIIIKHYKAMEGSVALWNPYALSRHLRGRTAAQETELIEDIAKRKIFVLDDLGLGKNTEFMLSFLYELLRLRIANGRNGLIMTSNRNLDGIAKAFGDDKLSSRIAGMCKIIHIDGDDMRIPRHKDF
jgi:DNA replication protein DnaC